MDNGKGKDIFAPGGGVQAASGSAVPKNKCYVKITGKGLQKALMGTAPASAVSVGMSADIQVSKALSGDFLVAAFGERPADITITGMDLYALTCDGLGDKNAILNVIEKLNVAHHSKARAELTLPGCPSIKYTCVLISALLEKQANDLTSAKYTLKLLGARKK